jgi:hypothetical protein
MEVYSRYFINFVRGLIGGWLQTDAFLFHTRLVHIANGSARTRPERGNDKAVADGRRIWRRHPDCDLSQDPSTTDTRRRRSTRAAS